MPTPSPTTGPHYLRNNLWGMVVLASGHLVAAAWYGDRLPVQLWTAFVLGGCGLALGVGKTSARLGLYASAAYMTLGVWLGHVALPFGSAVLAPYLAYCVTLFALFSDFRVSIALLAFSLAVPMALLQFGYADAGPRLVPPWVTVTWTFGLLSVAAHLQFAAARLRLGRSVTQLKILRHKMLHEQTALARDQAEVADASEANRLEIDQLTAQLMQEARLMDDLRLRQQDKKSVVHAIHHDLKEPLRSIVSFTQLAQRKIGRYPRSEALADYLGFAEDGGRRMSLMLEDLMTYANDAEGEHATEVELATVLDEVILNLGDSIERSGAGIHVGALCRVRGQRTQLLQLFQNLLSNALKFTRPGVPPRIEVTAAAEGEDRWYTICVSDNGIGIPPNQLDKVFGLFNRAHAEHAYEGSGVGLALCRKIVIAHGGQIRVTSAAGEGTQFHLRLQAVAPAAPPAIPDAAAAPETRPAHAQ